MATLLQRGLGLNLPAITTVTDRTLDDGDIYVEGRTATGDASIRVRGDFTLDPDAPEMLARADGALDFIEVRQDGRLAYRLDGVDVAAADFFGPGVEDALLFHGHDRIMGAGGAQVLRGYAGRDVVLGRGGDDTLVGGEGRDVLVGGKGRDVFAFFEDDGRDKVKDFAPGRDDLYFETASGFEDLTLRDLRKGVMITHDGGKVLLAGVELEDLSAGDFLFG